MYTYHGEKVNGSAVGKLPCFALMWAGNDCVSHIKGLFTPKTHVFWDPLVDEVLEAAWSSPTEKRRPPTCPIEFVWDFDISAAEENAHLWSE